jgi:hypothetical protein
MLSGKSNTKIIANSQTGGIVKTVLLPYDEIVNLKHELEHLKLYKKQQKELFEETIQGYRKDKIIRLQEWNLKEQDFLTSIKDIEERLKVREDESYQISKDYFGYKHSVEKSKQGIQDERELLLIERRALEDQFMKVQNNSHVNKDHAVQTFQSKTESFAQRFRNQSQKNENDLKVIKS